MKIPGKNIYVSVIIVLLVLTIAVSKNFLNSEKTINLDKNNQDWIFPDYSLLNFISLGNQILMSDLILAKALSYYGEHYRNQENMSFTFLKQMLRTAIQLDPKNKESILLASNLLSGKHSQDAISILKLGMSYHPNYWKFPEMIGFQYFFYLKDNLNAAIYYEKASMLPDHPPYIPSLAGKFYVESGRISEAIKVLNNFYQTSDNLRLKKSFKETITTLEKDLKENNYKLIARINRVIDGDSFIIVPDKNNIEYLNLKEKEEFRAIGIDSYEMNANEKQKKLFARYQRDFSYFNLKNRRMIFEFERDIYNKLKRDKYNRLLGYMYFLDTNKMYQEYAIEKGLVNGYYKFPFKYSEKFKQIEKDAQNKKKGLNGYPPKMIKIKELRQNIGKIVKVSFKVFEIIQNKSSFIINSSNTPVKLRAVVPKRYGIHFSKSRKGQYFQNLNNRWITITGFLQIVDEVCEIRLYYPEQLW